MRSTVTIEFATHLQMPHSFSASATSPGVLYANTNVVVVFETCRYELIKVSFTIGV